MSDIEDFAERIRTSCETKAAQWPTSDAARAAVIYDGQIDAACRETETFKPVR